MFCTCCAIAVSVIPGKWEVGGLGVTGELATEFRSSSNLSKRLLALKLPNVESPLMPRLNEGMPLSLSLDMSDATLPKLGSRDRAL